MSACTLYFQKLIIGLHFCRRNCGSIFNSFTFVQWAPKHASFGTIVRFGRSRPSKVDDFGINRKRVCDFLLARHCDYGPTMVRF